MTYDLEKIEQACKAATPGPWEWNEDTWNGGYSGITGKDNAEVLFPNHCNDGDDGAAWFDEFPNEADRQFIALARTALPELCARVRELEGELKRELISHERDERISDNWLNQACILQGKLNEAQAENAALRADNAELVKWFKAIKLACNTNYDPNKIMSDLADVTDRHILATPHPGDSLLKELEALRKVAEITQDWECFDYNVGLRIEDDAADNGAQRAYGDFMHNLREALSAAQRPTDCGPGEGKEG